MSLDKLMRALKRNKKKIKLPQRSAEELKEFNSADNARCNSSFDICDFDFSDMREEEALFKSRYKNRR